MFAAFDGEDDQDEDVVEVTPPQAAGKDSKIDKKKKKKSKKSSKKRDAEEDPVALKEAAGQSVESKRVKQSTPQQSDSEEDQPMGD